MDELLKYYEYLKAQKADVPDTFESFQSTLSEPKSAFKYYEYLRDNDFDAPDTFESFQTTFNLKKKPSPLDSSLAGPPEPGLFAPEDFPDLQTPSTPQETIASESPTDSRSEPGQILTGFPDIKFHDISKPMPGFVIPSQPTEFEQKQASLDEQKLRKGLGIDPAEGMTAEERIGSFAGTFNKVAVEGLSGIPKLGAIARRYTDVLLGKDPKPLQAYDMYKLGEAIEKKALDLGLTYTDPRNAGNFFTEGVPSGLASVLVIMGTGGFGSGAKSVGGKMALKEMGLVDAAKLAGKDLGKAAVSRPVLMGANMMGIQEFEQAKAAGATDEMALGVYFKNLPIGATEALPMERAFARIGKFTGSIAKVAEASTVGALEEATQEGLQQWLTNQVAAGSYDPKRVPWDGLISSMGVGAFIGFFLPMLGRAGQILTEGQQKETMEAINTALKEQKVKAPEGDLGKKEEEPPKEEVKPEEPINPTDPGGELFENLRNELEAATGQEYDDEAVQAHVDAAGGWGTVEPETPKEEVATDIPEDLKERGEPVKNQLDASSRFGAGERIFAFPEQDAQPFEITSVEQFKAYTADQLLAYPTTPVEETKPVETEKPKGREKIDKLKGELEELIEPPPAVTSKEEAKTFGKGFKVIGKNEEGNTVGEDDNGVRAVLKGNIVVSQPVGVIPGGGISVSKPEGQFLTTEEIQEVGSQVPAEKETPVPQKQDAEKEIDVNERDLVNSLVKLQPTPTERVIPKYKPRDKYRTESEISDILQKSIPENLRNKEITIKNTSGGTTKVLSKDAYVDLKRLHKMLNSQKLKDCIGRG